MVEGGAGGNLTKHITVCKASMQCLLYNGDALSVLDPVAFSVTPVVRGARHSGKLRPGMEAAPPPVRSAPR